MIGNLIGKIFGGIKETELEEKFLSLLSEFNEAKEMAALAVKKCDDVAAIADSALSEKSEKFKKLQSSVEEFDANVISIIKELNSEIKNLKHKIEMVNGDCLMLKTRVDNWSGYLENKNTQPVVKRGRGRPRKVSLQ